MNKKKRIQFGIDLGITLFIVFGILAAVNYLSFRHYKRWDVTQTQMHTLSDKTEKLLQSLKKPVRITAFYQPTHPLYKKVKDLLKEFADKGGEKLQIEFIDPDKDLARAQILAQKYKVDVLNTLVLSQNEKTKQISASKLAEYEKTGQALGESPKLKFFKAEEALFNALLEITQEKQSKVYFLTGHGEKDSQSSSQEGSATLKRFLDQNNILSDTLILLGKQNIPADADLLILAGPTKKVTQNEIKLLQKYINEGGKVWLLLDPLAESGMTPFLDSIGVFSENKVVVDPSSGLPYISAANLFISQYTPHPIVKSMKGVATLFVLTRPVKPAAVPAKDWAVFPLAFTSPQGWGESKIINPVYEYNEGEDLLGPVSVGVAVQPKKGASVKGRVVVLGDSEFITNTQLQNVGNRDLVYNVIQWLLKEEEFVSVAPKKGDSIELHLNQDEASRLFWISMVWIPFMGLSFGGILWWRRKQ